MALDIFSKFATDESAENNGAWKDIGGGARLLVARAGNRKYGKLLSKEIETNRAVLDLGDDVADKKSDEIMVNVLAESILLGWEGVEFKGEKLEYSIENAKQLLAIKDFRRLVIGLADDVENFRAAEIAKAKK